VTRITLLRSLGCPRPLWTRLSGVESSEAQQEIVERFRMVIIRPPGCTPD
jgi:hypothetical protein